MKDNKFAESFNELKQGDCRRMTEAYETLSPDAQRLYRLIEAAGMAIERADNATLGAVAGMARFQSCHCPLGQILQDVVGGALEKCEAYDAFDDDDEEDGDGDYVALDEEDIVYEDDEVVVYENYNPLDDDDGEEEYEDEDDDALADEAE